MLRISFLAALGITNINEIRLSARCNQDDLVAALQLAREGSCTFEEAVQLTG